MAEHDVEVVRLASLSVAPRVAKANDERAAILSRLLEIAPDIRLHRVRERDVRPANAVCRHGMLALDAATGELAKLPQRRVVRLCALPLRESLRLEHRPAARCISTCGAIEGVCAINILNVRLEIVLRVRRRVGLGLATELRRAERRRNCGECRRSLDVRGVHVHFSFQIIAPSTQAPWRLSPGASRNR